MSEKKEITCMFHAKKLSDQAKAKAKAPAPNCDSSTQADSTEYDTCPDCSEDVCICGIPAGADSTSETPRSVAFAKYWEESDMQRMAVRLLAELERELAQAIKERDKWQKSAMEQSTSLHREIANGIDARQQLAKAIKERDELTKDRTEMADELEKCTVTMGKGMDAIDRLEQQRATATEALEGVVACITDYVDCTSEDEWSMSFREYRRQAKQALAEIKENSPDQGA